MIKHLAILPARSGSKSIKDKNLLKLGGKTLIQIALEKALESQVFSRIIVSSDYLPPSGMYNPHRLGCGDCKSNIMTKIEYSARPKDLAQDGSLMIDLVKYILKQHGGAEKFVWVLQPTSPFRTVAEFKEIKKIMEEGDFKSLISWKPQKEHIDRTATWKNGKAYKISQMNFKNKQELVKQVHRSGNYYVVQREEVEKYTGPSDRFSWMIEPSYSYIMGRVDPDQMNLEQYLRSRMMGLNIDDISDYNEAKGHVMRGDVKI